MKKVLVLLSTYNGEKYVEAQIKSVLEQKNIRVALLIRDDGSTDNSANIINAIKDDRIALIKDNNIGAANSFFRLIELAPLDYDFYAFCDQDDFWESDKLYSAVEKLERLDENKPALYYSGQKLADKELNVISYHNLDTKRSREACFIFNQMAGCTAVFNPALLAQLKRVNVSRFLGHDSWSFKVCAALGGEIVIESHGHILYRQHENNVIGLDNSIKGKLFRGRRYFLTTSISMSARQILETYKTELSEDWKAFLQTICQASQGNVLAKLKLLKTNSIRFNSMALRCIFMAKVILGKI